MTQPNVLSNGCEKTESPNQRFLQMQPFGGVRTRIVPVTPEMATEWLAKNNTNNRRVTKAGVNKLAAAMLSGEFAMNGETVKFAKNGRLLDGQHRLMAVVKAGVTVRLLLVEGLEEETFPTIDTGRVRGASDVLSIRGAKNCSSLAAILRILNCHLLGVPGICTGSSNSTVDALYARFPNAADYAELSFKFHQIGSAVIPSAYWFIVSMTYGDMLDGFFRSVADGTNMQSGNPALALRNALIGVNIKKGQQSRSKLSRNTMAAFTIRAINAAIEERELTRIVFATNHEWPKITGDGLFGSEGNRGAT